MKKKISSLKNNNYKEKLRSNKKSIVIIVSIAIYAILSPFIVLMILQLSLNTEIPVVVIVSDSMAPTINNGDLLIIQGIDAENIENGTIILFKTQGSEGSIEHIIHRVIDKQEIGDDWYFTTKGDANTQQDPELVSEYDVLGRVVEGIPFIGLFIGFVFPILIIISVIIIISIVRDFVKEQRAETKNLYSVSKGRASLPSQNYGSSAPSPSRSTPPRKITVTPLSSQSSRSSAPSPSRSTPPRKITVTPLSSQSYGSSAPSPSRSTPPRRRAAPQLCPKCGARGFDIQHIPDKTRIKSYDLNKRYAMKYLCKRCRIQF